VKVRILPSARRDLAEGGRFYEKHAPGMGAYFLDALFADIDSLILYGGIHPVFFKRFHRMLSKRFPFAIYYQVQEEAVVVYAILDCRRDPAWTRERLT
jgi:plasmid stabilization system protein ParE